MTNTERLQKAKDLLSLDVVLDSYITNEFVEITGKTGGDTLTFRVYNSGLICEC